MNILGLTLDELYEYMKDIGQPKYRSRQVFSWLHKGVAPEDMTNIPLGVRQRVAKDYSMIKVIKETASESDTVKLLNELNDGNVVESVLMKYKHGNTLCISTQAGCRMNCAMCASTLAGFKRNLTSAEMIAQLLAAGRFAEGSGEGRGVSNIVMMGSGEPLDNYEETLRFLRAVTHPKGMNFGARGISVSTCGLADRIIALSREGLPVTLCVSLHSPIDRVRKMLLPINKLHPVGKLMEAVKIYIKKTGRRVIIQYTLIDGINDSPEQAHALSDLLKGLQCHVNVIRYNQVDELHWRPSPRAAEDAFLKNLGSLSVSVRRSLGDDVDGACGQLRLKHIKEQAKNG